MTTVSLKDDGATGQTTGQQLVLIGPSRMVLTSTDNGRDDGPSNYTELGHGTSVLYDFGQTGGPALSETHDTVMHNRIVPSTPIRTAR